MKILKLLLIPILFFACEKDICPTPLCLPPSFDVGFTFDKSFLTNELSEVTVIKKAKDTGEIISSSVIEGIDSSNLGSFYLGSFDLSYMQGHQTDFFYEIKITATDDLYVLDNFFFENVDQDPCSCPQYVLTSMKINDELITPESNIIILKK